MSDNSETIAMNPFLEKLDKLTYGLIYPAFLGDMIYDIIQGFAENGRLKGKLLYVAIVIVLFNGLDYMHLYVDMKKVVKAKFNEKKGPVYIGCDIASSCFFFFSFLLLKYHHPFLALLLLGLIPGLTAVYKEHYAANEQDRRLTRRYGIGFLILTIAGACMFSCERRIDDFLTVFVTMEVLIYVLYIFVWFPSYVKNEMY